jgi:GR25 family glycosyltransferase involved in LPS biosynthesis
MPASSSHTDTFFLEEEGEEGGEKEEDPALTRRAWPAELSQILAITISERRFQQLRAGAGPVLGPAIQPVPGVDGRTLPAAEELARELLYRPINQWSTMTRGQIGCYMSHRRAWQRVVDSKEESALILEDDCCLKPTPGRVKYIQRVFAEQLKGIPWDLVYLGRNPSLCVNKRRARENVVVAGKTWGLFAYAVTAAGAQKLLDGTAGPIRRPVDVVVSTAIPNICRVALSPIAFGIYMDEPSTTQDIK